MNYLGSVVPLIVAGSVSEYKEIKVKKIPITTDEHNSMSIYSRVI